MPTNHNPEKGSRTPRMLTCDEWEALLVDALDGTLSPADAEAFAAHSQSCDACSELLEETRRGGEWLQFLHETPEAPSELVEKILAGTSGLPTPEQMLGVPGATAIPREPWLGMPMMMLQRHAAESRLIMTVAMAFFSIALTLNLSGVRLNQLRLTDLRPSVLASSLSHEYFTSYAHMRRYYENLRIVYILESQVNEIRRDNGPASSGGSSSQAAPAAGESSAPKPAAPETDKQPAKPAGANTSGDANPADSSGRHGSSAIHAAPPAGREGSPVLASGRVHHHHRVHLLSAHVLFPNDFHRNMGHVSPYPGKQQKTSERSLV